MDRPPDLAADPLLPSILRLAGPAALMMLLQGLYNYVDAYFVGFLGADALAGMSAGSFVLWMTFSLAQLLSVGASAKVARRLGEGDRLEADRTALRGALYAGLGGMATGLALHATAPLFFLFMQTDATVTAAGRAYLDPLILGMPLMFLSFMFNALFSAAGDTRSPFVIMFLSLLLNVALAPLLVFGLGGFPALGVAGAAWATVIARVLWLVLAWRLAAPHTAAIALRAHGALGAGWRDFGEIVRIGGPKTATGVLFAFVYMALTRIAAGFGTPQIAALRIGHIYEGISFMSALGFSIAAGAMVGQNLGARQPQRAARAAWLAAGIVGGFAAAVGALFRLLPAPLASVFTTDASVLDAAAGYLLILAWSQPFMAIELVLEGAFSGAGDTVPPMTIQLPLTVLRWPAAYVMVATTGLGVTGVWWAISGSSILKSLLLAWWFAKGRWANVKV